MSIRKMVINNMKYFYLNLDRCEYRNEHIKNEIKKSSILSKNIQRVSAVDGSTLDLSDISEKILKPTAKQELIFKANKKFGLSITYGAVGCAMSHLLLYKQCVEDQVNFMILEDDAILNDNIDYYINNYLNNFNYDIFYFGFHRHSYSVLQNIDSIVNRIYGNIWGTFGYVVTPKFCEYCIDNIFPIGVQFDSEISKHINQKKITGLTFDTNIINSANFNSDIQGRNGMLRKNKTSYTDKLDKVFDINS